MHTRLNDLKKGISKKKIKVGVVGLGYVGLPLAIEFAKSGITVFGVEIDRGRLAHLERKESYISDVNGRELKKVLKSGKFLPSSSFKVLNDADVVIVCVPTPLKRKYHPDISFIKKSVLSISHNLKKAA
ncbi:MAG: UDP-N-acetyl-D-glucosamine dehydrogenase, partial [Candidatus Omnitrophica bacterium]|nr:UDP-N-acetyl-D-glucosamine dehydrogenase [Candidatus Omnitrophota bacterium]